MTEILAVLAGVGLAAACGFRIFLPLFMASLAIQTGVDGFGGFNLGDLLGDDLRWLGTPPVTLAFGIATLLEVAAYYLPWVDNALDTIATPTAMVAGTLMSFAFLPGVLDDSYLKWIAAAIIGGGTAGIVQSGTVALRGTSSVTTGGLGNFLLSSIEAIVATVTALLSVFLPVIGGIVAILVAVVMLRTAIRIRRRLQTRSTADET
ncbi:MAG: DUF4126 domain-containing protein [Verrucomicrobiales bacterium]